MLIEIMIGRMEVRKQLTLEYQTNGKSSSEVFKVQSHEYFMGLKSTEKDEILFIRFRIWISLRCRMRHEF